MSLNVLFLIAEKLGYRRRLVRIRDVNIIGLIFDLKVRIIHTILYYYGVPKYGQTIWLGLSQTFNAFIGYSNYDIIMIGIKTTYSIRFSFNVITYYTQF